MGLLKRTACFFKEGQACALPRGTARIQSTRAAAAKMPAVKGKTISSGELVPAISSTPRSRLAVAAAATAELYRLKAARGIGGKCSSAPRANAATPKISGMQKSHVMKTELTPWENLA